MNDTPSPAADPRAEEREADRASLYAALTLAFTLPGDTLLYLLLPIYVTQFGVTLPEAGILLAANRLIRIFAYGPIAQLYSSYGARAACLGGAFGSVLAAASYTFTSGLWPLLVGRLLWGLSYAAMNIANQALPTSVANGAARRAGLSRSIIAFGPMVCLVAGALIALQFGPRAVFLVLTVAAAIAPLFALRIPPKRDRVALSGPRFERPGAMSLWSFAAGFTLDGLFFFGLGLLAAQSFPKGAVLAAGIAMALRYAAEVAFAPVGGNLAHHYGARPVIILASFIATAALALLSTSGAILWVAILTIIVLRAMQQPLTAPMVAEAYPGPERVRALARQSTWRDIGAGTGPLAAGFLLPLLPPLLIYTGAAVMLGAATLLLAGFKSPAEENARTGS